MYACMYVRMYECAVIVHMYVCMYSSNKASVYVYAIMPIQYSMKIELWCDAYCPKFLLMCEKVVHVDRATHAPVPLSNLL